MQIVTWNMQGASHSSENKWNAGVARLFSDGADACCLQECGAVPASAELVVRDVGGIAGLDLYGWGSPRARRGILFYPADRGNRCNLALVTRTLDPACAAALRYPAAAPVHRPALGMRLGTLWLFSLHAISPGGADARGLVAAIATAGPAWVAAGDYNREPETLAGRVPGSIWPPDAPTHPSTAPVHKYDYAVAGVRPGVKGEVLGLLLSDHLAVRFRT